MSEAEWTIQSTLQWMEGYLAGKGDENPRLSAQWLMSAATGLSRVELFMSYDKPLSMDERDVLRASVTRRGRGEPLQYITGTTTFRHISLDVREGVLIPRPETEVLVSEGLSLLPKRPALSIPEEEYLLALARKAAEDAEDAEMDCEILDADADTACPERLLVADICTGSGCIACSLAYEHPLVDVIATDLAPEAVALCAHNAEQLELTYRVRVLEGDLGTPIDTALMGAFDLVISNPPYIPTAVMSVLPDEVAKFEPELALDGGEDGLDLYRRLADWTLHALKPGGGFCCELHETCLDEAAQYARDLGFVDVCIREDLTGRPRILSCRRQA